MDVTSAEFRDNMSKYLSLLEKEDIYITRHKKVVGVLTAPSRIKKLLIDDGTEDFRERFETYMRLTRDYLEKITGFLDKK